MSNFEKIKRYYERGIYKDKHLRALVAAGAITAAEYAQICGHEYEVGV